MHALCVVIMVCFCHAALACVQISVIVAGDQSHTVIARTQEESQNGGSFPTALAAHSLEASTSVLANPLGSRVSLGTLCAYASIHACLLLPPLVALVASRASVWFMVCHQLQSISCGTYLVVINSRPLLPTTIAVLLDLVLPSVYATSPCVYLLLRYASTLVYAV